jgi:hypothetical protein
LNGAGRLRCAEPAALRKGSVAKFVGGLFEAFSEGGDGLAGTFPIYA